MKNLLKDNKILRLFGYQAAGTTNIDGASEVDMSGYESVLFILTLGTMVNLASVTMTIHQGDTSGDLSESVATSGAVISDGTAGTQIVLEVVKPKNRYLEPQVTLATQDTVVENIIAILGNPRDVAVTQDDAVISDEIFLSPADA